MEKGAEKTYRAGGGRYDKSPTSNIYTTWVTQGVEEKQRGSMPLGLFLFSVRAENDLWIFFKNALRSIFLKNALRSIT